jgi:MFS family permease
MFVYTLNFVDRTLIAVVAQPIIDTFSLSDTQWGLIYGPPFALFYALMGIPIAMLADRFNRVVIISVCIVIWSVMTALCGLTVGFLSLLLCRVGVAIGEAGCTPPANAIISDYFQPSKRAKAFAVYSMGVAIGIMLANLFGGPIAQLEGADVGTWLEGIGLVAFADHFDWANIEGWRIAFVSIGLPGVLVAALLMLSIRDPARGAMDGIANSDSDQPVVELGYAAASRQLLRKPTFWWMVAGAALAAFGSYGVTGFQAPFLQREHELDVRDAALYFGAPFAAFSALGTFLGGVATQRFSRITSKAIAWVPAGAFVLAVPCYILAFYADSLSRVFVFWALAVTLHYAYVGSQYNIAQGVVSARARATAVALLLLIVSIIGSGIGPYFVGFFSDFFMQAELGSEISVTACNTVRDLSPELSDLCARSNSTGLKKSICLTVCVFFISAFCFWKSGETLERDFVARL